MSRPQYNVLMVLADQHHAGLMGCAGHPQAITPRLDAFAAEGLRFDNAYCNNPICTPSRTCILSGQYCHNHGYYGLGGPTDQRLPNLFRHFKANGYRTAGFGKLHLPNGPRNWIADDVDRFADAYEDADGNHGVSEFFEELTSLGLRELEDSWHNTLDDGRFGIADDARPSKLPYEHTVERWCEREALAFIDAAADQPFCIQVAFQKPHHPLLPQPQFWDLYPTDLDLPETFDDEPVGRPPHFRQMWQRMRQKHREYAQPGETYRDGARRAWRGTLACVSQVDDVFGRLLDALDERGLADNTIVIYGSDHGCYHGLHGIVEKAPGICSEDVCKVPLIWRVPGLTPTGATSSELVELVDLTPTLTGLCGLPVMATVDGLDLSGLLSGGSEPVREVAVTECPWSKSIRWDRWRMVHYPQGMFDEPAGELYDVLADPLERQNLYFDAEHAGTVAEGQRRLIDWLVQTTRLTTSMPTAGRGSLVDGVKDYQVAGDGRAPRSLQPRDREGNLVNYL